MRGLGGWTAELVEIAAVLREPRGGWRVYAVAASAASIIVATWVLLQTAETAPAIRSLTGYRADDGWAVSLVHLPLSAFAPTVNLPVWGAALQVFAALALAGAVFGWRMSLLVGVAVHIVASLLTRAWLALPEGPGRLGHSLAHAADTGPSVLFVSLLMFTCVAEHWFRTAAVFIGALAVVGALSGGLAATEHLSGLVVGSLLGIAARLIRTRTPDARLRSN